MSKLLKKMYHVLTLDLLFPLQYARYRRRTLKAEKVVFIEANLPELSNSLWQVHRELEERGGYDLHVHCLREAFCPKGTYIRNALACLKDMGDAKTVFLCEGSRLVSCIKPRQETRIAQVWHGCGAFKRFGLSTSELLFGGDFKENTRYSYYKNYDLVTVSSPEVAWAYREAMNLPKNSQVVKPIGVSRTDVFFQKEFLDAAAVRIRELIPETEGKKILLYAPTFRGSVGNAQAPDKLDLKLMKDALGGEYVLLMKHHPVIKTRPAVPKEARGFAWDVSDTCSIEDLICVSSLCISDYSSLVFEYSLMERPLIFFAYDLEEYGDWRGFYYDYEELTPGPVVRTTEEVADQVRAAEHFDGHQVAAFRQKYMSACDGDATRRLLALLNLGEEENE